jgi:hypothetical protein
VAQVVEAQLGRRQDGTKGPEHAPPLHRLAGLGHEDQAPVVQPGPSGELFDRLCGAVSLEGSVGAAV